MAVVRAKVVDGGRVILPAAVRKAMGLSTGDTVFLELDGDELRLRSAEAALRRVRERLRPYRVEGVSAADELIAERRAAAEKE